jgi:predicted transcriptional regulator
MWTMCFVIVVYSSGLEAINLPIVITFSIPYLIILWKRKKKESAAILSDDKPIDSKQIDNTPNPEPKEPQYIETGNMVYRTDGKPITDDEVPYLMQLSYEKSLNREKVSSNPKFHRTEREDELSYQFECTHGNKVCQLERNFENLYRAAYQTDDISECIRLLEESALAFEKAKKFCYSKGKGGTIYFQDMWEYMHNSQNDCFSYLDNILDALEELKRKRDIIIPSVLDAIRNNDGILQKNIYSYFPDIKKSEIQAIIKELETNGTITRTKKSNSYELHINNR